MILDTLFNPNYLTFWAFWGMLVIVILMKSWHKIIRFNRDIGRQKHLNDMSDEELKKNMKIHFKVAEDMKKKHPDYNYLKENRYVSMMYHEYCKRGLSISNTSSQGESKE